MIEKVKSIGWTIVGGALMIGSVVLGFFLIQGSLWVGAKVFPWLMITSWVLFFISLFLLLPLSFFNKLKPFTGGAIFVISYIFGLTLWFYSAIATYILWGFLGLFLGLIFAGVGVLPLAGLASIFNGQWMILVDLIILIVLTFGARFLGLYIMSKGEQAQRKSKNNSRQPDRSDHNVRDAEVISSKSREDGDKNFNQEAGYEK